MITEIERLLLNLFFILIPLFLFQLFWLDKPKKKQSSHTLVIGALTLPSLLLCMSFPFSSCDDFNFDLRLIPLLIGILYGGYRIGLSLLIVLIVDRYFQGNQGFYLSTIIGFLITGIGMLTKPFFVKWHSKWKILFSTGLSFICATTVILGVIFASPKVIPSFLPFSIEYIIIYLISSWVTFSLIEMMIRNTIIREGLLHNEKLKVVSKIAASVSHEVRNPLTVMKGFMHFLKTPSLTEEKRKQYIDICLSELERAQQIITDYLTYAKNTISKEEDLDIDIASELQYIADIMSSFAFMRKVNIITNINDTCFIKVNRLRLQQCFINLLKNSIEAMPNGGELFMNLEIQADQIVTIVEDTGIGMTKEQIAKLGTPYYTTKNKEGTGLGSMVIFQVIKECNGKIKINSELGKGTKFIITFPR